MKGNKEEAIYFIDFKSSNTSQVFKGSYDEIIEQVGKFRESNSWGTTSLINISLMVVFKKTLDPLTGQLVDVTHNCSSSCKYPKPVDELNAFISLIQKNYEFLQLV